MSTEIPFWMPQVSSREYELIREVLESNFLNDGPVTARFERKLAELVNTKHVVAVTSGTAALYLALTACGIGHGDEAVVPDVTFIATANAVAMTGAMPVLADIDPNTMNIDPRAVERVLTPRTKAIIPVHISGRAADMDGISEIASRRGIGVIEDAAEALLSSRNGRCLGTIGLAGCVSFSPNKTITTGQGGAIFTDDDALHVRLRELKDQGRPFRGTGGADVHNSVGFNFKFTNLQAAVGLGQLEQLQARVDHLKGLYHIYSEGLAGLKEIRVLDFNVERGEVPQWIDVIVDRRDELDVYLQQRGIHCRKFWHPLHTQRPYKSPDEDFPQSTHTVPKALWLPSAFTISDADAMRVCAAIRQFLEGK